MIELKPCPFCGGEAKFFNKYYTARGVTRGWDFGIFCSKCDVTTPRTDYKLKIQFDASGDITTIIDERLIAAETWNRRANNDQP